MGSFGSPSAFGLSPSKGLADGPIIERPRQTQAKPDTIGSHMSTTCVMFVPSMRALRSLNRAIAICVAELAFAVGLTLGVASFVAPVWLAIASNPIYCLALVLSWPAMKLFGAAGVAVHDAARRSVT